MVKFCHSNSKQADKSIAQLERKMKRKSDLDLDVKMAKTKQAFDIGLRKFHAFSEDWNQSKALQIISQGFWLHFPR